MSKEIHTPLLGLLELEELKRNAKRYEWLKKRFLCADFGYDSGACSAMVFEMPDDMRVSADLDKSIEEAIAKEQA